MRVRARARCSEIPYGKFEKYRLQRKEQPEVVGEAQPKLVKKKSPRCGNLRSELPTPEEPLEFSREEEFRKFVERASTASQRLLLFLLVPSSSLVVRIRVRLEIAHGDFGAPIAKRSSHLPRLAHRRTERLPVLLSPARVRRTPFVSSYHFWI